MAMRTVVLDYYLDQAQNLFGSPRNAVDQERLRTRFENQNYAGVMGAIKTSINLEIPLRIGWKKGDLPQYHVPVTLEGPDLATVHGSPPPTYTVYMYKETVEFMSFEMMVAVFAHLLTRLTLHQKQSSLVDDPAGIDVVAMLLGFNEFYTTKNAHEYWQKPTADKVGRFGSVDTQGGLTYEEAQYVASKLRP
jgi:hypothetical protein